jgi:hypothetical protein
MSAQKSALALPRVGETLFPKCMFYGSMVPDSVMGLRTFKEGSKLLLARLYKFAGDAGVRFRDITIPKTTSSQVQEDLLSGSHQLR